MLATIFRRPVFQFLIGRLDTYGLLFYSLLSFVFQFLIGRLDTEPAPCAVALSALFQFLIGRLDTCIFGTCPIIHILVSIPYR